MESTRIAIIDPVGKKAGMDHYDNSLAIALNKRSYNVKIYSNYFDDITGSVVINHFRFVLYRSWFGVIRLLFEFLSALKKAKAEETEIILLHIFHSSLIDYLFIRLSRAYGFKVCFILHDVESLVKQGKKFWLKECVQYSSSVIVHTEISYKDLINKTGGNISSKVFIVPHGNYINLPPRSDREAALKKLGLDPSLRYIILFGMIKQSKGLEILIQAMSKVSGVVHLIIAGRSRDVSFTHYQSMIDKQNLTARIHSYIRYITNEERLLFLSASDLAILPYKRIYQSGVFLLAMSCGLPVITSDLPENTNSINNKQAMFFLDGNPSDLAAKINELIADDGKRKTIADNAREYVIHNHDWEIIGDLFANILNK